MITVDVPLSNANIKFSKLHRPYLRYLYENHLSEDTVPNYKRIDQLGWIAVAKNADSLSTPRSVRSFDSLFALEGFTYFRPNQSYTNKSYRKRKIRWMVVLTFDFDNEHLELLGITCEKELIGHVESLGFKVSAVIKTPSGGFHVHLPLSPLRGYWNGDSTIKRVDCVIKGIAKLVGSDPRAASVEHYFRLPTEDSVVYFCPLHKPSIEFYESLLDRYRPRERAVNGQVSINYGKLMSQKPFVQLLSGAIQKKAVKDGSKLGRNNAAYTMALAMKKDGWDEQGAREMLFNTWYKQINTEDFSWGEAEQCIRNAFKSRYKGPSSAYVFALTGMTLRPITPAKERAKRQDHFYEIKGDLLRFLECSVKETGESLCMSQDELAKVLDVKKRSLEYVIAKLKFEGKMRVEKVRKGRSYVSIYCLIETDQSRDNEVDAECLQQKVVNMDAYKSSKDNNVKKNAIDIEKYSHRRPIEPIFCANDIGLNCSPILNTTSEANLVTDVLSMKKRKRKKEIQCNEMPFVSVKTTSRPKSVVVQEVKALNLVTLCERCQNNGHIFITVPDYENHLLRQKQKVIKCPKCRGGKLIRRIDYHRNVEEDIVEFTKMQKEVKIPYEYLNTQFNKEQLLISPAVSDEVKVTKQYERFVTLIYALYTKIINGEMLKRDVFISTEDPYLENNLVYACMIELLRKNKKVVPYIDTQEIYRLIRSDLLKSIEYFESIRSCDICFIKYPNKIPSRIDVEASINLVEKRKMKGYPTVIISKVSPESLYEICPMLESYFSHADCSQIVLID